MVSVHLILCQSFVMVYVMAVRDVLRMGHPILRMRARELSSDEVHSKEVRTLIRDMVDTMHAESGIGIAAPQVGVSVRLALIELEGVADRYPEYADSVKDGLGVYINPKIAVLSEETQSFWEGCLSVPGLRGLVSRSRKIRVDYWNERAEAHSIVVEGFLATVFQHEFDHLDGVLYVDRVEDTRNLSYVEEYQRFLAPKDSDSVGELED